MNCQNIHLDSRKQFAFHITIGQNIAGSFSVLYFFNTSRTGKEQAPSLSYTFLNTGRTGREQASSLSYTLLNTGRTGMVQAFFCPKLYNASVGQEQYLI